MTLDLPKNALDVLDWDWAQYEPHFTQLAEREIDASNVGEWLSDWTQVATLIAETYSRLNLAADLHSDDEAARNRFHRFLEEVYEKTSAADQKLKEKLLASKLEPQRFAIPLRNMRAEADLFREENLPLLTEHQTTGLEYNQIVGSQTIQWNGKEVTLAQLVDELKGGDRMTRERGWMMGINRVLADREAINAVWVRLMELRKKIAANAGKKDYCEYVWQSKLRFEYTPQDCETFHAAIEKVVVPAAKRVYERHARLMKIGMVKPWDMSVDVMRQTDINVDPFGRPPLKPFSDMQVFEEKSAAIFRKVDPRLGEYFDTMRREKLYDLPNYRGKAPGAYCTSFPASRRPFVLMNATGGAGDVDTMHHEMGHAFHAFQVLNSPDLPYHQLQDYPFEFAEVASMGMELLASPYLPASEGGYYTAEEMARAMIIHLEQQLMFFPFMAVMDSFQHWVYTHDDQATDPANCDAKWGELWDRFIQGVDWNGLDDAKVTGWHRKVHLYLYPFYYVEYGLAQLGALQVWRNALKDQKSAVTAYLKGLSLGFSVPLPELFKAAGAKFAFNEDIVKMAVDLIEEQIARQEANL